MIALTFGFVLSFLGGIFFATAAANDGRSTTRDMVCAIIALLLMMASVGVARFG
jgi:hypothetical protein